MTAPVRYRERLTMDGQPQVEVEVMTPSTWGSPGNPLYHYIRYPDVSGLGIPGREYIVDTETLNRHFEQLPGKIRIQAWGGVYERPMKSQRALDAQIEAEEALAAQLDTDPERID
jgi:hypothetical protein